MLTPADSCNHAESGFGLRRQVSTSFPENQTLVGRIEREQIPLQFRESRGQLLFGL